MLRSEKAKTTYIQELTKDDVRKMKDQLDHIDPEKLIKDSRSKIKRQPSTP